MVSQGWLCTGGTRTRAGVVRRRVVEAAARAVGADAGGGERLAHERVFVDALDARGAVAAQERLAHGRRRVDVHVQVRALRRRAHALPNVAAGVGLGLGLGLGIGLRASLSF